MSVVKEVVVPKERRSELAVDRLARKEAVNGS